MNAPRTVLLRTLRAYPLIVRGTSAKGWLAQTRAVSSSTASTRLRPHRPAWSLTTGAPLTGMGDAPLPAVGLPFAGTVSPLTSAGPVGTLLPTTTPSGRTVTVG